MSNLPDDSTLPKGGTTSPIKPPPPIKITDVVECSKALVTLKDKLDERTRYLLALHSPEYSMEFTRLRLAQNSLFDALSHLDFLIADIKALNKNPRPI